MVDNKLGQVDPCSMINALRDNLKQKIKIEGVGISAYCPTPDCYGHYHFLDLGGISYEPRTRRFYTRCHGCNCRIFWDGNSQEDRMIRAALSEAVSGLHL